MHVKPRSLLFAYSLAVSFVSASATVADRQGGRMRVFVSKFDCIEASESGALCRAKHEGITTMKSARCEKPKAAVLLATLVFSMTVACAGGAFAQTERKRTRIGGLNYEGGFPTADTVNKLYDELDFERAVLAFQYAEPLVAFDEMNVGLCQFGGMGDLFVRQRIPNPHAIALTVNSTTIYAVSFLDLKKNGLMVVEVTPGSYGAFFDLWQQTFAGIGPTGADKGKGGNFLVQPTGEGLMA